MNQIMGQIEEEEYIEKQRKSLNNNRKKQV